MRPPLHVHRFTHMRAGMPMVDQASARNAYGVYQQSRLV
jgi:hypothetical protein